MSLLSTLAALIGLAFAGESDDYRIGPGDELRIEVHGQDFGSVLFRVGGSGEVSFPYVGKVQLGGMTSFEAEDAMVEALKEGYLVDPQVSIRIEEFRAQRVEVLGAVDKAGVYYLDGQTSVRAIIGKAGGIHSEKSTGQIVVTSKSGEALLIPIEDLEGPLGDHLLSAGDVVNVDEGRLVYVTGEVAKGGAIPFIEGITVSEALARAGGRTPVGWLSKAHVLREGEKISVNIKRILKGKDADFQLQPGDQLFVPESPL